MQKRWKIAEPIASDLASRFPEIPRIMLQILVNRGVLHKDMDGAAAQNALDAFMNPDYGADLHDPFLFRDMRKAVARIDTAIRGRERIVVYGDYDADGVSGAVILTSTLSALGADVHVYIPHRETEGYGVNMNAVEIIANDGARMIITCDCGISNAAELSRAKERGIDVIITDHHTIPPELPPAIAIIHPLIPGELYPWKGLAGGGVAFKLAQALLRTIIPSPSRRGESEVVRFDPAAFEKWLLDMVVVSTVGDMMPILGENRTLVKYGLVVLNKTKRIGLQKLIEKAGLARNGRILDTYSVGWGIAPRINAAGRMDHANTAYQLCMTEDPKEAMVLADALNAANQERQSTVQKLVEEATAMIGDPRDARILIVAGKGWPLGLVGLVAGKVSERFYRPTLVLTNRDGELAGSGRSVVGVNLMHALQSVSPVLLKKFGGHPMACGFTLANADVLPQFREELRAYAEATITPELLIPTLSIDGILELQDVNWKLWEYLEHLEPFGEKNPRPRYCATGATVVACRRVGEAGAHVQCTVEQDGVRQQCISFNGDNLFRDVKTGDTIDIVFEIDVNEWNGNRNLQLKIIDIRKAGNSAATAASLAEDGESRRAGK